MITIGLEPCSLAPIPMDVASQSRWRVAACDNSSRGSNYRVLKILFLKLQQPVLYQAHRRASPHQNGFVMVTPSISRLWGMFQTEAGGSRARERQQRLGHDCVDWVTSPVVV